MKFKPILSVLSMLLLFVLAVLVTVKIWNPDAFDDEIFYKVILSFVVLTLFSVGTIVLSYFGSGGQVEQKKQDPHP